MLPLLSFPFPLLPFAPWAHSHLPTNRSFTRFPNNTSFPLTLSTYSLLVPSLGSYYSPNPLTRLSYVDSVLAHFLLLVIGC